MVTGNHVKFARFVLLGVSEEAKNMTSIFFVQCIIKQFLDSSTSSRLRTMMIIVLQDDVIIKLVQEKRLNIDNNRILF